MKIVIKEPDNKPYIKDIEDKLEVWQNIVGGFIEVVNLTNTILIVCNDEGKIKGLNMYFTWRNDIIVGTVCFVGDDGEEFRGLTENEIFDILHYFDYYEY